MNHNERDEMSELRELKLAGTQIDARNDREILGDLPATKEGG